MAEQAAAVGVRIANAPEMGAIDARNSIMPGESLVDERVVRSQELHHAPVFADNMLNEKLCFPLHRVAEILVELWKKI
jgi:hypothetical protein